MGAGCPTLAAFLFLLLGWDIYNYIILLGLTLSRGLTGNSCYDKSLWVPYAKGHKVPIKISEKVELISFQQAGVSACGCSYSRVSPTPGLACCVFLGVESLCFVAQSNCCFSPPCWESRPWRWPWPPTCVPRLPPPKPRSPPSNRPSATLSPPATTPGCWSLRLWSS